MSLATQVTAGFTRVGQEIKALRTTLVPVGVIQEYAGATAPSGYLMADGSAVSRTTYAALFAVIGTTYGVGNGFTTFNLPDRRERVGVGKGGSTDFDTLGETGGSKTHTHPLSSNGGAQIYLSVAAGYITFKQTTVDSTWTADSRTAAGTIVNSSVSSSRAAALAGATDADSSLQPYITLNYIIKT